MEWWIWFALWFFSISDIQDYFEFINKTLAENPPIQIYPNKIKSIIVFKVKTGCKLELLSPETMKLLRSAKKDVDKDKDGEDVPKLKTRICWSRFSTL